MYTNNYYDYSDYGLVTTSAANNGLGMGIWLIIALVLAVVGGILVYFLFIKSKTEPKGKFAIWLKSFLSFDIMWIESILKVIYYIATIFIILASFALIGTSFLAFLCCLVLGPIALRIVYEATMMFIMIWKNTSVIAKNTKK